MLGVLGLVNNFPFYDIPSKYDFPSGGYSIKYKFCTLAFVYNWNFVKYYIIIIHVHDIVLSAHIYDYYVIYFER